MDASQKVDNGWTRPSPPVFQADVSPDNPNDTFYFTFNGADLAGKALDFTLLSLLGQTYSDRPNGLREDVMQSLEGLGHSWIRFPGGNNMQRAEVSVPLGVELERWGTCQTDQATWASEGYQHRRAWASGANINDQGSILMFYDYSQRKWCGLQTKTAREGTLSRCRRGG